MLYLMYNIFAQENTTQVTRSSHLYTGHSQVRILSRWSRTSNVRQISIHGLVLHSEEMLPNGANLRINLRRVRRVPVLHRKAIRMIDIDVAIGRITTKQRPEEIPRDDWVGKILAALDDAVEGFEGASLRVVGGPVVFSYQVDFVHAFDEGDVIEEFGIVGWVVVVGEDVDCRDGQVGFVDTVNTVHDEFLGS